MVILPGPPGLSPGVIPGVIPRGYPPGVPRLNPPQNPFKIKDDLLEIQVTDKGIGFDKSKVAIPKIEEKLGSDYKRGWGLQLIKELMDTVKFESTEEGTTVTMTKKK